MRTCPLLVLWVGTQLGLLGCNEKSESTGLPEAGSTPSTMSASAAASATSAPGSATPSAAAASPSQGIPAPGVVSPVRDLVVFTKDPDAEPRKEVQASSQGTIALYLPQYAGTKWTVTGAQKRVSKESQLPGVRTEGPVPWALKPKEETIPGFTGTTPGIQLSWSFADKSLLPGDILTFELANTKTGEAKPSKKFTLLAALH